MLEALSTKGKTMPLIWINAVVIAINCAVIAFNIYWLMHR
jgi:hypothetical protein